jgi:O-methyltransferase involved in polyketide biosynthesis
MIRRLQRLARYHRLVRRALNWALARDLSVAAILDGWLRRFIAQHPTATVVELSTGLNTRFDRLDNGTAPHTEA